MTARTRDHTTKVFLEEAVPEAELKKHFPGQVVSLWQYGVGDKLELDRVVSSGSQNTAAGGH